MLAFACAFTMFAGAAFTDSADINADNADAVELLTALNIIDGYEDGSFNPDGVVTRAEMAKMIYTIRNGGNDDASAYETVTTSFTDINGHWAEGYIKYLQNTGIVSGKSATKFDPDSQVTTGEAMKMALVLAGYDEAHAGLAGSAWLNNTVSYATTYGLTKDVHSAISGGCARQDAAQILSNGLSMDAVVWSEFVSSFVYDGTEGLATGNRQSVGKKWMDLWTNIGTLTTVDGNDLSIHQDANDVEDSDNNRCDFTNLSVDYSSLLGQKVKVLFSDNKANEVIGVFATGENTVYTADMKDVEDDGAKVKFGGASYAFDEKEIDVVVIDANEEEVRNAGTMSAADFDAYDADPTTDAAGTAKLITASVRFVDNDGDGKLNIAIITEYKTAKVTYVGADRITAGTTYRMEDENISDEIAKNDYAVMSYNPFDECLDIVKADVVSDTLSGVKKQTGYKQYQIGGTWYNIDNTTANNVTRGDTVLAYVVNGIAIDIKSDDGTGAIPSNIAVVVGNGGDASVYGDQIRLRYFDGTNKIVTLSDQNKTLATQGVAFRVSGSDESVRLENLTVYSQQNEREYNGYRYLGTGMEADPDNGEINNIAVADDAVIILYTTAGQSKQITGKQFKALNTADIANNTTAAKAVFTKAANGLNRVRLASVLVGSIAITGASSDNYAYVTSASYVNGEGNTVMNIWTGSENKTVTMNGSDSFAKGTLIGYSDISSDNIINDVTDFGTVEDATKESAVVGNYTANTFYTAGNEADDADDMIVINNKQLNVTSDTHVLVVESANDKEEEIGIPWDGTVLPQGKENADGSFSYNAWFTTATTGGDDTDLEVLVIDNAGVFSAFDESNEEVGGAVEGDYTTTYAAVNVSDKEIITGAGSKYVADDKEVHVQLTVEGDFAEASATAEIDVDGYKTSQLITLKPGATPDLVIDDVNTTDAKVTVNIKDITITKANVSVAAKEGLGSSKGISITAVAAAAKAKNETVTITATHTGTFSSAYDYTITVNGTELTSTGNNTNSLTFTYTVSEDDVAAGAVELVVSSVVGAANS